MIDFFYRVLDEEALFVPLEGSLWLLQVVDVLPTPGHTHGHMSFVSHRARTVSVVRP